MAFTNSGGNRPSQLCNLDQFAREITAVQIVPNEFGLIIGSENGCVQVWLKRDNGQYWPSINQQYPSAVSALSLCTKDFKLFVGFDNGLLLETKISTDYNKLEPVREIMAHRTRILSILYVPQNKWVISSAVDRTFTWHSCETGTRAAGYTMDSVCNCLEFDSKRSFVYMGTETGSIITMELSGTVGAVKNTSAKIHKGPITSLSWDSVHQQLYTASSDKTVGVFKTDGSDGTVPSNVEDPHIRRQKALAAASSTSSPSKSSNGEDKERDKIFKDAVLQLCFHNQRVSSVTYFTGQKSGDYYIISGGEDGNVVLWNMPARRFPAPLWSSSNVCEKCNAPFIWNFKGMWEDKTLGCLQHHCRLCGQSLCDKCSPYKEVLPNYGFELPVRLCKECYAALETKDKVSLIKKFNAGHAVTYMHFEEKRKLLATVGKDRTVKLWDLASLL